jgi:NADH-quinone oxidoreductase subunit N
MLAYSSIAHAGYILIAFAVQAPDTLASASFYLLAYTVMNLGAFGALIALGDGEQERVTFRDLTGAAAQKPLPSLVLALCLLSLAGFPPLAGFLGKFFIFRAAIESGWTWLAIVGVLNSLVSVYFYLGPVVQMYMGTSRTEWKKGVRVPALLTAAVVIAALATVALGILPLGIDFAQAAALR